MTNNNISEVASEIPKRRGRPPAFDDARLRALKALFPEIRTHRGLMNRAYAIRAIGLLRERQEFRKLVPPHDDIMAGRADIWSFDVLTELGRYSDESFMRAVAKLICETPGISRAIAVATAKHNRLKWERNRSEGGAR